MKRELEELKEVNSKKNAPSPTLVGSQLGDWNRSLLEQKMKETREMISYKTMASCWDLVERIWSGSNDFS